MEGSVLSLVGHLNLKLLQVLVVGNQSNLERRMKTISGKDNPPTCALEPNALKTRVQQISALARESLRESRRVGAKLELVFDASAAPQVRRLVTMERECCGFLDFKLEDGVGGFVELTISGPATAIDEIQHLFSAGH